MVKKTENKPIIKKLSEIGPVSFVSSGIEEIDELTGGFPRARITELYGKTAVGKTFIMTKCLVAMSESSKVLYIDAENALNIERVKELGGDSKKIEVSSEYMLEEVADLVLDSIEKYDIIIVDSVAGLIPRTEHDGDIGSANIGIKAKLIHQWMRKMVGKLGKSKCAVVLVNQLRESPDMYTPKFTTGGLGIPYSASLRIELSNNKTDRIQKNGEFIGHNVHVEITKSKVSRPHLKTKFKLLY